MCWVNAHISLSCVTSTLESCCLHTGGWISTLPLISQALPSLWGQDTSQVYVRIPTPGLLVVHVWDVQRSGCLFLVVIISPLEAPPSDLRPNTQLTEYPYHLPLSLALFLVGFLVLFIFNWRIVALQYCVGFCHTSTWISHDQLTHWKRLWCWEKLKAKGDEGGRGWDGWMASSTQWTWTWVNFGR